MKRVLFALVTLAFTNLVASAASAAELRDFDRAAFVAAQSEGKPILVHVHASWCPVCASQGRTLDTTLVAPEYQDMVVFRIDYDKQKDEWKAFGARKQGTLIAFRGEREAGRLVFVTAKAEINKLVAAAVR